MRFFSSYQQLHFVRAMPIKRKMTEIRLLYEYFIQRNAPIKIESLRTGGKMTLSLNCLFKLVSGLYGEREWSNELNISRGNRVWMRENSTSIRTSFLLISIIADLFWPNICAKSHFSLVVLSRVELIRKRICWMIFFSRDCVTRASFFPTIVIYCHENAIFFESFTPCLDGNSTFSCSFFDLLINGLDVKSWDWRKDDW